jgi:ABC-type phosphate/phosphonate transport system substrate-binding protein
VTHSWNRFVPRLAVVFLLLLAGGTRADGGENPFGTQGLRFGYSSNLFSEVSRSDAQAAITLWTRELSKLADYRLKTELIFFEDLPMLAAAIRDGTIDFVGLGSLDYMRLRGLTPMVPALTGRRGGKPGEEQVLLVRRDSGITSLGQLKGRMLALLNGSSGEIASLWLDTVLARQGLPIAGKHFAGVKDVGRAQAAILPVFFKQVDACVVSRGAWETAAELNPQVGRELSVLANSPMYPIAITCFRSSLSEAQKEEFVRLSLKMVTTPSGKQILTLFKVDTIARADSMSLENLATLVKEHDRYTAVTRRK